MWIRAPRRWFAIVSLALATTGSAQPPAQWPVCPSPVELLPLRGLFVLRHGWRGRWLPEPTTPTAPLATRIDFDDAQWLLTALPGLEPALLAARGQVTTLALRRLFHLRAETNMPALLHLPAVSGALRVWLDGVRLPLPAVGRVPRVVELPQRLTAGSHVLYLEHQVAEEVAVVDPDPIGGEIFFSRPNGAFVSRQTAHATPAENPDANALISITSECHGSGTVEGHAELWRLSGSQFLPLQRREFELQLPATHVHGFRLANPVAWLPDRPTLLVARVELTRQQPIDRFLTVVAPRGYRLQETGLSVNGRRVSIAAVTDALPPDADLPNHAAARFHRYRIAGANTVVLSGHLHEALFHVADRLGLLLLIDLRDLDVGDGTGPSVQVLVRTIEQELGNHPSLAGFVLPSAEAHRVKSKLGVLAPADDAARAPAGALPLVTKPIEGLHLLALQPADDTDSHALASWRQAAPHAAGVVVPAARCGWLKALQK
jgi:hypothetical protein